MFIKRLKLLENKLLNWETWRTITTMNTCF